MTLAAARASRKKRSMTIGGGGELGREDLDGDALAERKVLRLVHGGHAAAPDLARDPVLADQDGPDRDLRLVARHLVAGKCYAVSLRNEKAYGR